MCPHCFLLHCGQGTVVRLCEAGFDVYRKFAFRIQLSFLGIKWLVARLGCVHLQVSIKDPCTCNNHQRIRGIVRSTLHWNASLRFDMTSRRLESIPYGIRLRWRRMAPYRRPVAISNFVCSFYRVVYDFRRHVYSCSLTQRPPLSNAYAHSWWHAYCWAIPLYLAAKNSTLHNHNTSAKARLSFSFETCK